MMQTKLIFRDRADLFEKELNNFLKTVKVIDIKFTTDQASESSDAWFNALVLFEVLDSSVQLDKEEKQ